MFPPAATSVRGGFTVGLAVVKIMTAQPRMAFLDRWPIDVVCCAMGFLNPKLVMQAFVRKKRLTAIVRIVKAVLKGGVFKLRPFELGFGALGKLVGKRTHRRGFDSRCFD